MRKRRLLTRREVRRILFEVPDQDGKRVSVTLGKTTYVGTVREVRYELHREPEESEDVKQPCRIQWRMPR